MRHLYVTLLPIVALLSGACSKTDNSAPIHALLITGGCCHDYDYQKATLTNALSERAPIKWSIVQEGGDSKDFQSKLFNNSDWSADYDVVVHNQC